MSQVTVSEIERSAGTPRRSRRKSLNVWGERLGVGLIVLGILGLIQPWVQNLYTNGFTVLLFGTIIFIVASHL